MPLATTSGNARRSQGPKGPEPQRANAHVLPKASKAPAHKEPTCTSFPGPAGTLSNITRTARSPQPQPQPPQRLHGNLGSRSTRPQRWQTRRASRPEAPQDRQTLKSPRPQPPCPTHSQQCTCPGASHAPGPKGRAHTTFPKPPKPQGGPARGQGAPRCKPSEPTRRTREPKEAQEPEPPRTREACRRVLARPLAGAHRVSVGSSALPRPAQRAHTAFP